MAPSILGLASAILGIPTITTFIQNLISALTRNSEYIENVQCTRNQLQEFEDEDLLGKMSILLTPTGYSDGSLNTIIPPYQVLPTELVTNGTFDTDTDWNLNSGVTISGGTMNFTSTPGSYGSQDIGVKNGVKYKITFEITSETSGSLIIFLGAGNNVGVISGLGKKEIIATASTNLDSKLYFGNVFTGSIDNVSVKEIQEADFDFSRGSSATRVNEQGLVEDVQILSGELVQNGNFAEEGSELVTNGNFDTDSDWSNSGSWSIGNGVATYDGLLNIKRIYQTVNFVQNKIYKISFDITNTVDDYIDLFFGQDATTLIGRTDYAVGSYEFYVTATSTSQNLSIYAYNTSYGGGSIDNVSVKEVGQNWTFGTGWSMGDGKVIADGTMTASDTLNQSYNFTDGNKYRFKFTVSDYQSGSVYIREPFNGGADAVSANGTFTFDYIAGSANEIRFRSDNGFIGSLDNVSYKEVTDDTDLPRIDYSPYSGAGTCGHILLEPQRTNLITYSEDFSQWLNNTTNLDVPSNVTQTNPSGGSESGFINVNNGVSATKFIYESISTTSNIHTQSVFFKYHSRQWIQLLSGGTSHYANFDIQNGVVGNVSGCTATIKDYGSGWYRCTATLSSAGTPINFVIAVIDDDATSRLPVSTGTGSYYVWGAQTEVGDYATSYIPTSGSTVTRSSELANNSGNADLFNDSEGVLYAEVKRFDNDTDFGTIGITDGSGNNQVTFKFRNTTNLVYGNVTSGGTNQVQMQYTASDLTVFNKLAIKYKENNFALWFNGVEVLTDTSGIVPTGLNELAFDNGSGANLFIGKTKCVAVFKEALSNDELELLTGEGYNSFAALAAAYNYNVI